MYVYIWEYNDIPFYVGQTKHLHRLNPLNLNKRSEVCNQFLQTIDRTKIVVTIHTVTSREAAKLMEAQLIAKYGRQCIGTGTLLNSKEGGEVGWDDWNPPSRASAAKKLSGAQNPAKRPEVREKIRASWLANPERRERERARKLGKPIHSEAHKEELRQKLLGPDNPMRDFHKILNSDPEIKAKRVAALLAPEVQEKIKAKLNDPEAKAKRLAKLKATQATPEYKAACAARDASRIAAIRATYASPEWKAASELRKAARWAKKAESS